ncbi:Leucine Rich Repeat [Seminavis robusta]|uniref:Leucine Rich Repeat n=1 Tax=Seminavis robusta TaxID=568900 RepID=A0A9N8HUP7_9STRA|nr:Leucine Rich Repeat [Seminavis robusta]|eukprot:Sro2133_g315900.1 Leucine Rich Repeat (693) ;mRNA; f:2849-5227
MKEKKTQSQDVQPQPTGTLYDALGNSSEKKGEHEKTDMEVVIGHQHPLCPALIVSSLLTLSDIIRGIEPVPSLASPAANQAGSIRQDGPGAYSVHGHRSTIQRPRSGPLTGRIPDMEGLGLEMVPTSQANRDHDTGLIHADPIDASENGMIPTAEPISKRAKRLWKKKLFLFLSMETMVAQVLVLIILVAFLLAPKTGDHKELTEQQNGVIPVSGNSFLATTPKTQPPLSLWERLNLPQYTLSAMENPRSPQTKAYQWLSINIDNSNNTEHLAVWRLRQKFALATFYYSTRGDHWVENQGWLDWDTNECNWTQQRLWDPLNQEVNCDDDGKLLSLQFWYANNLDGTMPPEISLLCNSLEIVAFARNYQLKGSIPTEVGLMTKLALIQFFSATSSGTLPTELGQLQSLKNLLISGRELIGTLPTELGNLSNLTGLVSEGANFSGSIPAEVLRLSNLKTLIFSECPLLDTSSFLPGVVRNLHNLEILGLGSGKTGGFTSIPTEIGRLTNLQTLKLTDFRLNGTLVSEMGMLTKLNYLYLERNSITGTLPEELSKMSQLKVLLMSSNQLEGSPLEQGVLHQLTQLQELHINDNLFSGSIATEIGSMNSLEKLEVQDTNLSGTLPTDLLLLDNLTSLVLSNTSLTGSIPDGLCGAIVSPHERKFFGGNFYSVPTTNLSVCYGTSLCGCTCEHCPKA